MTAETSSRPGAAATAARGVPVHVYKNYDLVYWWIVWLYAGLAWIATWLWGTSAVITDKAVKFSTEPLVGIGFVVTFLFVAIFTSLRARGATSTILLLVLLLIGLVAYLTGWANVLLGRFPELRIYVNSAFYSTVFVVLFPVWVLTTFVLNRFHHFTFDHGRQVGDNYWMWGGSKTFVATNLSVTRMADDIFVHRILGLWWLGFGTGDIVLRYTEPGGGMHHEIIPNVWCAGRKVEQINSKIR